MHSPWPGPCTCTDRFQTGSFLLGPDPPCPETTSFFSLGMTDRLTYRKRWPSSPNRRGPSFPYGRITPPRLLFHNTLTAAKTTRSSYNHSSTIVFPRGVHSTVVAVPSSPPTTVRHAPPDVEAFCATSLLPKELASVAAPRQPPEGRHHSLSRPHISLFGIGPNSDRQPSKTRDAPIRRGTSFRIGVPPRNSGPCTAQNLKLPPATVETKIRPPDLLSRLNDE